MGPRPGRRSEAPSKWGITFLGSFGRTKKKRRLRLSGHWVFDRQENYQTRKNRVLASTMEMSSTKHSFKIHVVQDFNCIASVFWCGKILSGVRWIPQKGTWAWPWNWAQGFIAWNWESTVRGRGIPWGPISWLIMIPEAGLTLHSWLEKKNPRAFLERNFPWKLRGFLPLTCRVEQTSLQKRQEVPCFLGWHMNNKFLRLDHHSQKPVSPKVFMLDQHSLSIYKVSWSPGKPHQGIDANSGYVGPEAAVEHIWNTSVLNTTTALNNWMYNDGVKNLRHLQTWNCGFQSRQVMIGGVF